MSDNLENKIIEVSLIGTGGGYGECIVINLGNHNWVVVDSCRDPFSKKSLPLEYLQSIGVDVSNDVKLVLCTHWHDDHILGISELLEECNNANLCIASATDRKKFLLLVGLDYHKCKSESSASSTKELSNCIDIIKRRGSKIVSAVQDRLVFSSNLDGINSQVYTLTPSDFVLEQFNKEISSLMVEYMSSNSKIISETPNDKSVTLLIKVNDQRIILGSDLEVTEDNSKGWLCILDNCQCIDFKSSLFKIPHHGSKNGFHERILQELLEENAIAKLTPWNRGGQLPKKEMLKKYKEFTDNLYMTTLMVSNKPKNRDRSIAKAIERFNKTVKENKYGHGIIHCKINLSYPELGWEVALINKAIKVTDEILKQIQ